MTFIGANQKAQRQLKYNVTSIKIGDLVTGSSDIGNGNWVIAIDTTNNLVTLNARTSTSGNTITDSTKVISETLMVQKLIMVIQIIPVYTHLMVKKNTAEIVGGASSVLIN